MVFQWDLMNFVRWYDPSQAYNVKHVSNPQLTATGVSNIKLAYGPVPHGYIKITSEGMDFEVLVEIANSDA